VTGFLKAMKRRGRGHRTDLRPPAADGLPAQETRAGPAGPALLPHERDEIADPAVDEPRQEMRRAARDLQNGLVDTEARAQALRIFERANPADSTRPDSPTRRPRKPTRRK